ncbi:hypothetical protein CA54_40670 [Symmachiella macrocystis]|uniref:Uncharacterized protein n=1 Tax=Symmachiella macrocystis TaxID=2527985 RepID=A0A5C6BA25_9PLAN|nr:hypothetical protein [Symmachiella macrocystis]TWU08830.1 hypothetical protein CA54_40670 [Symmachiella macrocystis]
MQQPAFLPDQSYRRGRSSEHNDWPTLLDGICGGGSNTILCGAHNDNIHVGGGFTYISTFAGYYFIVAYGTNYIDSGLGNDFVYGFNLLDDEEDLFDLLARTQ